MKECKSICMKDRVCIHYLILTHSDVSSCPWMLVQGQHGRTRRSGCAWAGSESCIVVGTGRKMLRSATGLSQRGYQAADVDCPGKDRRGEPWQQEGGWPESLTRKEVSREMALVLNCRGDSWSRRKSGWNGQQMRKNKKGHRTEGYILPDWWTELIICFRNPWETSREKSWS